MVNLNWKDGKPERFEITSKKSGNFNIIFKEKQIPVKVIAGQVLVLNKKDFY